MVLLCVLNSHYVLNILHYAYDGAVSSRVRTDRTDVSIRYVVAHLTIFYIMPNTCYRISKAVHVL